MSIQPPDNRIALDAAAVVQSLSRCAAEFQAKAAAQKALVQAATSRKLGLVAADAALMVEVYEEAAASLFSTIQGIMTGRVAGAAGVMSTTPPPQPLQAYCDTVSPTALRLCRRVEDAKLAAPERYAALVALVRELSGKDMAKLPTDAHAALAAVYAAIVDKLPDLGEVAKALQRIEAAWRKQDGADSSDSALRRNDWFKKMLSHVDVLVSHRLAVADGDITSSRLDGYEKLVDVVLANMTTQKWPGGECAQMATAIEKELRRLRSDCGVVVAMSRLRGMGLTSSAE